MGDLNVKESHTLPPSEAVKRVQSFEEMISKYGVTTTWSGQRAKLKGVGVSGSIEVTPSHVCVTLKLGLLARAAGVDPARLERSIRRRLQTALHS
jgi:putative polyhydroxyalkanoate system protein